VERSVDGFNYIARQLNTYPVLGQIALREVQKTHSLDLQFLPVDRVQRIGDRLEREDNSYGDQDQTDKYLNEANTYLHQ
jgi:hypothetical protein